MWTVKVSTEFIVYIFTKEGKGRRNILKLQPAGDFLAAPADVRLSDLMTISSN